MAYKMTTFKQCCNIHLTWFSFVVLWKTKLHTHRGSIIPSTDKVRVNQHPISSNYKSLLVKAISSNDKSLLVKALSYCLIMMLLPLNPEHCLHEQTDCSNTLFFISLWCEVNSYIHAPPGVLVHFSPSQCFFAPSAFLQIIHLVHTLKKETFPEVKTRGKVEGGVQL